MKIPGVTKKAHGYGQHGESTSGSRVDGAHTARVPQGRRRGGPQRNNNYGSNAGRKSTRGDTTKRVAMAADI